MTYSSFDNNGSNLLAVSEKNSASSAHVARIEKSATNPHGISKVAPSLALRFASKAGLAGAAMGAMISSGMTAEKPSSPNVAAMPDIENFLFDPTRISKRAFSEDGPANAPAAAAVAAPAPEQQAPVAVPAPAQEQTSYDPYKPFVATLDVPLGNMSVTGLPLLTPKAPQIEPDRSRCQYIRNEKGAVTKAVCQAGDNVMKSIKQGGSILLPRP